MPGGQDSQLPSYESLQVDQYCTLKIPLGSSSSSAGPGVVIIVPWHPHTRATNPSQTPTDPEPVDKWATQGFAVAGLTVPPDGAFDAKSRIQMALRVLREQSSIKAPGTVGLIIHDNSVVDAVDRASAALRADGIACIIMYLAESHLPLWTPPNAPIPTLIHASRPDDGFAVFEDAPSFLRLESYPNTKPLFALANYTDYNAEAANLAHSRSVGFIEEHISLAPR
ncbi:hypothetical protein S7711_11370 [Stachybotrys chartarum IBT 7711]|uniref:Uncharacterized protein n=1 Tax=Stachybotrys chartarum (strain CBS 109288 / IBT 7711) TaxID=1280523 RepID=A0A084ALS7_STACB|nr:hypothetical protein S7711_11370 [Stachybotrys chartarum IBT 7711]KFA47924.1 hypothetical protein S40293_10906 [Stachybotrys chartarum IBT 40293]